jgi:hypothetical protein
MCTKTKGIVNYIGYICIYNKFMNMNIINDEINKFNKTRKHQHRMSDNSRLNELFFGSINEGDENLKQIVVDKINNNDWEKQNPESFRESLLKSRHPLMLTDYTSSELSQMKLFKLNDLNIGYALKTNEHKPYSEIVAVHNNEPNVRAIGNELMQSAISNGGCYLDHFDVSKLTNLYQSMGFDEFKREPYNAEYDTNGEFKNSYGEVDIIYRKYRGC